MAVSDTPNTLNPMNRGGKWVLTQDPGTPPVYTHLAWELDINGTVVTEESMLTTSSSDEVVVDPRKELVGHMLHQIPALTAQSVYNMEAQMIAEVSLNHGTVEIDASAEPVTKTVSIGSTSGPFDFINANISAFDGDILNDTTIAFLSSTPDEVYTTPFAYSWIYILGTTGINGAWRKCDGTTGTFSMSTAGFAVAAVPCGPLNLGLDPDVEYYTLEFAAFSKTIKFHVQCGLREEETGNIIFLEPIGGLSGMGFESSVFSGSAGAQTIAKHYEPDSTFATWAQYGGRSVVRKSSGGSYSMSKRVRVTPQYQRYVQAAAASSIAFVVSKDNAGNTIFLKADITGANISQAGEDGYGILSVSAQLLHGMEALRSVY